MTKKEIHSHIQRLGLDLENAGPCSCLVFEITGQTVRIWDDWEAVGLSLADAKKIFTSLPTDCGPDAFWEAINGLSPRHRP